MRHNILTPVALAIGLAFSSGSVATADFDDLLTHMPAHGNVVMFVNADKLYQSELAKREDWQGKHAKGMSAGGLLLPPGTRRIAVAASMNFQYMNSDWEAAAIDFSTPLAPQEIAERTGGTVDVIGTTPVIALPDATMVIPFSSGIVGVMTPATRQRAAKWIDYHGEMPDTMLPAYLERAAEYAKTARGQIILAFDFEHTFSPAYIRQELGAAASLAGKQLDLDQLSKTLAGVRGLTIGVFVDASRHGKLKIDFNDDVTALAPFAKVLVLEALAGAGGFIDDFSDWQETVKGQTIELEGPLSESGLHRLLSLVELPTHWLAVGQRADQQTSSDPNSSMAYASLAYFHNVRQMFHDLAMKKYEAKTLGQAALFYDRFADRIDRLPKVNVDPELLDYGVGTAEMLRQAALAQRTATIGAHDRKMQIYPQLSGIYNYAHYPGYRTPNSIYGYGRPYGRFGYANSSLYFQYRNIYGERRMARADEIAKGAAQQQSIMDQIEDATSKVGAQMTKKYQMNF